MPAVDAFEAMLQFAIDRARQQLAWKATRISVTSYRR
jgi:hypothetical protein